MRPAHWFWVVNVGGTGMNSMPAAFPVSVCLLYVKTRINATMATTSAKTPTRRVVVSIIMNYLFIKSTTDDALRDFFLMTAVKSISQVQ